MAESSDSGEQVDETGIPPSQEEPPPQDFSVGLMDDFYSAAEEVIDQAFLEHNRLPLMVILVQVTVAATLRLHMRAEPQRVRLLWREHQPRAGVNRGRSGIPCISQ